MDFAIIETGGKQYKITPETDIEIEKITGKNGDTITFNTVLLWVEGDKVEVGNPYIDGKTLEAEIVKQTKGDKIRILRFRHKSRHRRHVGHRQQLTEVSFTTKKTKVATKATEKTEKKVRTSKKTVTSKTAKKEDK